jgi:uncharacterized protein YndB with AHSA1/START domain
MHDMINRVSSEAVAKATGKTWDEWIDYLDGEGGRDMTHKELVLLLKDRKLVESGWWQQMVTVGYEFARGSRVTGETADAGFEIGVQKTFPLDAGAAWKLITSPEGTKLWLGDVPDLKLVKGQAYTTSDGITGEVRSVNEGRHLRLTRKLPKSSGPSTFQVSVVPAGNKTSIRVHHEKLAGENEREEMRNHWQGVLNRLFELV